MRYGQRGVVSLKNMKVFAFDLGQVVFTFDYTIAFKKLEGRTTVSSEIIIDKLFYADFATDFEKGLICGNRFYQKFKDEFKVSLNYDEFVLIWCDIFFPQQSVIDLIGYLRKAYPIYLISNINELHFDYLYKNYPDVFSLFNDLILSFKEKAVKPQIEIYEALRKISRQSYENIVYIDDRLDLISQAKLLNMHCIQFKNFSQLIADLQTLNITIP